MKRLTTAALVPVLLAWASPAAVFDFEFGAYIQLPFENTGTVVGLIAVIANADSGGFSSGSGTECPPPKPAPADPEAE